LLVVGVEPSVLWATFIPEHNRIDTMARRTRPTICAEQLEAREVPATAFALGDAVNPNTLFRFDTATPTTLATGVPVTGLQLGDTLVGTDFRPATGQLYALGVNTVANTLQLYTIDITGAATAVGANPIILPGTNTITGATKWGVDFNPVADRLRVTNDLISDVDNDLNVNNLRINPNTGALVAVDPDLVYTGLAGGIGDGPEVTVAYDNNDVDPTTTTTTLRGIVSSGDALVLHSTAPGFQTLTTIGALGVNTNTNASLDIYGPTNTTAAILNVAGVSGFYTINLTTGAATLVGLVGTGAFGFLDVSVAPPPVPVLAGGQTNGAVLPLTPTLFGTNAGQLTPAAASVPGPVATPGVNTRVATGDVNGDGVADFIFVTGPGTPIRVSVTSGADGTTPLVAPFDPFGGNFTGGGYVSAIDFDPAYGNAGADGKAEFVVTPDQGGGPRVSIFTFAGVGAAPTLRANFFGIDDPTFRGGARSATAFLTGSGTPDLVVVAGFGGGPRAAIFRGTTLFGTPTKLINDFFAFPGTDSVNLRNGVFVAGTDINGDGIDELVFGGGPGGAPRVFILDGAKIAADQINAAQTTPVANFFVAGNTTDRGGVRLAFANLDGDARGDLVVGSGEGSPAKVRAYRGVNFTNANEPGTFQDLTLFGGGVLPGGVFVG
jgi:hypothetical protein